MVTSHCLFESAIVPKVAQDAGPSDGTHRLDLCVHVLLDNSCNGRVQLVCHSYRPSQNRPHGQERSNQSSNTWMLKVILVDIWELHSNEQGQPSHKCGQSFLAAIREVEAIHGQVPLLERLAGQTDCNCLTLCRARVCTDQLSSALESTGKIILRSHQHSTTLKTQRTSRNNMLSPKLRVDSNHSLGEQSQGLVAEMDSFKGLLFSVLS